MRSVLVFFAVLLISFAPVGSTYAMSCGPADAGLAGKALNLVIKGCSLAGVCGNFDQQLKKLCQEMDKIMQAIGQFESMGTIDQSLLDPATVTRTQQLSWNQWANITEEVTTFGQVMNGDFLDIMNMASQLDGFVSGATALNPGDELGVQSQIDTMVNGIDSKITQMGNEAQDLSDRVVEIKRETCSQTFQNKSWKTICY